MPKYTYRKIEDSDILVKFDGTKIVDFIDAGGNSVLSPAIQQLGFPINGNTQGFAQLTYDAYGNVIGVGNQLSPIQNNLPMYHVQSSYVGANGALTLGSQVGTGTATFGATSGSTTCILSLAGFLNTAADIGRVITLLSGPDIGKRFTITANTSTTQCTGTLESTLTNLTAVVSWSLAYPFGGADPNCFLYFPAGKVYAAGGVNGGGLASIAGSYYCQMSTTTQGVVFDNVYDTTVGGLPKIPVSPVAVVDTGPGAFTQTVGLILLIKHIIKGNSMGITGMLRINPEWIVTNNANAKAGKTQFGASTVNSDSLASTNQTSSFFSIRNEGVKTRQIAHQNNRNIGSAGNGGSSSLTVDTSVDNFLAISSDNTGGAATDNICLVSSCVETFFQ